MISLSFLSAEPCQILLLLLLLPQALLEPAPEHQLRILQCKHPVSLRMKVPEHQEELPELVEVRKRCLPWLRCEDICTKKEPYKNHDLFNCTNMWYLRKESKTKQRMLFKPSTRLRKVFLKERRIKS